MGGRGQCLGAGKKLKATLREMLPVGAAHPMSETKQGAHFITCPLSLFPAQPLTPLLIGGRFHGIVFHPSDGEQLRVAVGITGLGKYSFGKSGRTNT